MTRLDLTGVHTTIWPQQSLTRASHDPHHRLVCAYLLLVHTEISELLAPSDTPNMST